MEFIILLTLLKDYAKVNHYEGLVQKFISQTAM
jgi:hypothetical protein